MSKSKIIYLAQSYGPYYIFLDIIYFIIYIIVPRVGQLGREASVLVGEPGDDGGGCSLVA